MTEQADTYSYWTRSKTTTAFVVGTAHVNNVGAADLFNDQRFRFFVEDAGYSLALDEAPDTPALAELVIRFMAELRHPIDVDLGMKVTRIGKSSFALRQVMIAGGRQMAVCETAFVNVTSEGPAPLPAARRAVLEKHLRAD